MTLPSPSGRSPTFPPQVDLTLMGVSLVWAVSWMVSGSANPWNWLPEVIDVVEPIAPVFYEATVAIIILGLWHWGLRLWTKNLLSESRINQRAIVALGTAAFGVVVGTVRCGGVAFVRAEQ